MSDSPSAPGVSDPASSPPRFRWWDHAIGLGIASTYTMLLVRTARTLGYARDEGFYFEAARSYVRWILLLLENRRVALARPAIDAAWTVNHEHPSLMKTLFGLSWHYLHVKHRIFAEAGTAFRFPGMVMAAACLWLVYVWGTRAVSRRAGLVAAACLALMPRVFYHAHLDCFDAPVMFFWALTAYCYWRSLEGRPAWGIATGVAWGLALNVKFQVLLLPAALLMHWFIVRGRDNSRALKVGGLSIPLAFASMLTIGFALFFMLWPWMWFDTFLTTDGRPGRLGEYLGFHWNHAYYNMEFFGFNWFRPPFPRSYPYVMIAITVPAITLVLALVGVISRWRRLARDVAPLALLVPAIPRWKFLALREYAADRPGDDPRGTDLLWLAAGGSILALWWKPNTPIFGGTKHWFTLYPFLALFAGAGFEWTARALERVLGARLRPRWLPGTALAGVCLLSPLAQTAHSHPFGLSTYTPIAGGNPGGADLGMNRQFWGYTTGSLVGFFNRELPQGGSVFIHDTAWPSWEMMVQDHRVNESVRAGYAPADSDLSIVHHELHMNEVDYQIWQAYQSPATFYVLTHDGVPIVSVYRRPPRAN